MSREPVELQLVVHAETVKAWGVTEDGDADAELIWLSKSTCEIEPESHPHTENGREIRTFHVPEWLAQKEGLI